MRIYHNIPALTAYNALNHTSNALQKTIQKLSTGLRINSASDDAAGLAISEKMRAQISGLEMAQRNAQDGISMLQTAEGAIQSTQSILQRMRELAVQASNDTLTAEDRSYIQLEVSELKSEVDRIAHTTQFNGKRLLDGSSAGVVSSSNLSVKAYVRGSLREIDQFGQKKSFEGNYKIQIKASGAGQGEAQKSAIMVIKHPNVITDVNINTAAGVEKVSVDNVPAGDYKVETIDTSLTEAVKGTGLGGQMMAATAVPGAYTVEGANDLDFGAIDQRSMTVTIDDGTNQDVINVNLTTDLGNITALAAEIQGQIGTAALANTGATVTVSVNSDGKIEITSDKGSINVAEATGPLANIMGTGTETDSVNIATGTAAPTSWVAGGVAGFHDFTVTYGTTATAFRFNISGNYSTDAQTLVDEMNRQLDNAGVSTNDLRAEVVTVNGADVVRLHSSTASFKIEDGDDAAAKGTAGAVAAIFGDAGLNNSTAILTGGTFDSDFSFDYENPVGLTGGTKAMTISYTNNAGAPATKDVILDGTAAGKTAKDMKDLVKNINSQLAGTGIRAEADGNKVKLVSNQAFSVADKAGYNSGFEAILGTPESGNAVQDTSTTRTYADFLSLFDPAAMNANFTVATTSVPAANITINSTFDSAEDLADELNSQFSNASLNVSASVTSDGYIQLASNEEITLGGNYANILGTIPSTSSAVTNGLSLDTILPAAGANIKSTFTVTTDSGTDTITIDGAATDITSGAKLVSALNNQLVNSGARASIDSNGFLQITSTESSVTIANLDAASVPAGYSGYEALFGVGTSTTSTTIGDAQSSATLTGTYGLTLNGGETIADYLNVAIDPNTLENNASILFEVTAVGSDTITLKATSNVLTTDGTVKNYVKDNIILSKSSSNPLDLSFDLGLGEAETKAFTMQLTDVSVFQSGTKFVYNVNKALDAATYPSYRTVQISGTQDPDWPDRWGTNRTDDEGNVTGAYLTDAPVKFGIDASKTTSKDLHFRNFYVNSDNGKVYEGDVVLTTGKTELADKTTLTTFNAAYIGKTATGDTKLRDLSAFWNSQGVFMLESPQTITITQGDGKTTSITLYATDTLNDMRSKLNSAIATGLGQAQYATGNTDKFCTFVEKTPGVDMPANGLETVAGTFIFRSLVPGAAGRLTFSGDQDVINAFSMNVVTEPQESSFTASIYDAHTGQAIATNVKVTDNNLIGILHPNVDIEFDPMANITAQWSPSQSNFITTSESVPYEAVIHLVDSSTVYQVGANKGEDLALDIGDMTAGSLGITKVNVATREAASRAIGQLDAAINKVSAQRAKIGAYQNSLEYTIENLQTTATNLTAAESRIRDADMAKTMMEFVKLQILNQSGTSMLAQANQLPQQVLSLLQ